MTEKIDNFARDWVSSNIGDIELSDVPREIDRLAAKITADARLAGISGGELARSVGDLDDYLTVQYENKRNRAGALG